MYTCMVIDYSYYDYYYYYLTSKADVERVIAGASEKHGGGAEEGQREGES